MKVIRATSQMALDYIREQLQVDPDYDREYYEQMVAAYMVEKPQEICVLLCFDGQLCIGHMIGLSPQHVGYVYTLSTQSNEPSIEQLLFKKLLRWTIAQGKEEVRVQLQGEASEMVRKWRFKLHSSTWSYVVPDFTEETDDVGSTIGSGVTVGGPVRREQEPEHQSADEKPEADRPADNAGSVGEDRTGSGAVSGPVSWEPPAGFSSPLTVD